MKNPLVNSFLIKYELMFNPNPILKFFFILLGFIIKFKLIKLNFNFDILKFIFFHSLLFKMKFKFIFKYLNIKFFFNF